MKIALLSDLHLSMLPFDPPGTDADVVVLAGDLGRPDAAIDWARRYRQPTLFVAGNHEYYGSDLSSAMARLRTLAAGTPVRVLERDEWKHEGVRFLGATLWADHRLCATPEARDRCLAQATALVRDFSRIRVAPGFDDLFSPALSQCLFDDTVAWLDRRFTEPHDGPTVVITHFAPSRRSIAARFADSPLNGCFVSDLEAHILRWQPGLWLHGHTHDSFDYRIGSTRVIANPRGYVLKGEAENKLFDPALTIEVDSPGAAQLSGRSS